MALHDLIAQTYDNFQEQAEKARVILLHPKSNYRSILLATLMKSPDYKVFYYALGPDDITLRAFITGITHDLANQHPTFGRHLNMMPPRIYEKFDDNFDYVLETFAREIDELSDEPFLLVLDEYDRCDAADDVQRFTERLVSKLPPHGRMVLNSRTLPRLPWVSMIAKREAVLLMDDTIISEKFYGTDQTEESELEVFGLGPGYVLFNGEIIENWEGHLPRLLFFFVLDRPVVTRSEICQAFWPDLEPDQAVNVFHVTKRRLHKALGVDVLVHDGSYYSVNPELTIYFDVMEFAEIIMEGRSPNNENPYAAWQEAARIYRGDFLKGHDDAWIVNRREAFRAGYVECVRNMAQTWEDKEHYELALSLYKDAIEADERREDLRRDVMNIYMKLHRRNEAVAHYQKFEKMLKKAKQEPEAETVELYERIVNEE